ncbi:unnamed protein product [Bursaphelenchus okinawaensis]|uniref:Uncharacterized protein n=1 Tax=Bursaphelenchus okinawaensis TaxID=465554 RepID=A0A811K8P4_9BILA|nr:unnamed protein product [Bursaphelenchus okinawaensis]CAG9096402.1 unnamed protein product [Bursaphelenchus okinawaensis]
MGVEDRVNETREKIAQLEGTLAALKNELQTISTPNASLSEEVSVEPKLENESDSDEKILLSDVVEDEPEEKPEVKPNMVKNDGFVFGNVQNMGKSDQTVCNNAISDLILKYCHARENNDFHNDPNQPFSKQLLDKLKEHNIELRPTPILSKKRCPSTSKKFQLEYKAVCMQVKKRIQDQKDPNFKQRVNTLNYILNEKMSEDKECLSAYQVYLAHGFMMQKEKFQPISGTDFNRFFSVSTENNDILPRS